MNFGMMRKLCLIAFMFLFFGSLWLLVISIFAASGFFFVQDGRSVGFVK